MALEYNMLAIKRTTLMTLSGIRTNKAYKITCFIFMSRNHKSCIEMVFCIYRTYAKTIIFHSIGRTFSAYEIGKCKNINKKKITSIGVKISFWKFYIIYSILMAFLLDLNIFTTLAYFLPNKK